MKQYTILQAFKGSNDGLVTRSYEEGDIVSLSDELGEVAVRHGWAAPHIADAAEHRETKVEAPAETKPAKPLKKAKA